MDGNTTLILINIFIIGIIAIIIVKLYYRKHEDADEDIDLSFTKNPFKGVLNRDNGDYSNQSLNRPPNSLNKKPANNNRFSRDERSLFNSPSKQNAPLNQRHNHVTAQKEDGIYAVNNVNINNGATLHKFQNQPIKNTQGDNMNQQNNNSEKVNFGSDVNVNKTEKKDIAEKLAKKDSSSELINEDQSTKKETYTEVYKDAEPKIEKQNTASDHELKDLFTIDELIKESKRKDSKREKKVETPTVEKEDEPAEESKEEKPVEVENKEEKQPQKETTIADIINQSEEDIIEEAHENIAESYGEPSLKTPTKVEKSIDDVIKETVEEKIEEMPEPVDQSTKKETYTEIYKDEEPIAEAQDTNPNQPLKEDLFEKASEVKEEDSYSDEDLSVITPNEDDFGSSFDESSLFGIPDEKDEEDDFDLDYRKDIAKITNKVKNSKIFNAAKNKISSDEDEYVDDPSMNEDFIRNVRSYDEPEYETYEDYGPADDVATIEPIHNATYDEVVSQKTREENTAKLNKKVEIKEPPAKDNITFKLNNNDVTLHRNDEIIYSYNGDSYSSKVYKIVGDDITVKFRGQYINIKTSDIKKIF